MARWLAAAARVGSVSNKVAVTISNWNWFWHCTYCYHLMASLIMLMMELVSFLASNRAEDGPCSRDGPRQRPFMSDPVRLLNSITMPALSKKLKQRWRLQIYCRYLRGAQHHLRGRFMRHRDCLWPWCCVEGWRFSASRVVKGAYKYRAPKEGKLES